VGGRRLCRGPSAVFPGGEGCAGRAEPGFSVEHEYHSGGDTYGLVFWSGWVITNKTEDLLTVRRVTYNGEHQAPIGMFWPTGAVMCTDKKGPVTLTIGENQPYFEAAWGAEQSYLNQVIFLDIDTDRGRFRYRVGEGFE
jgi:hypothetical protein